MIDARATWPKCPHCGVTRQHADYDWLRYHEDDCHIETLQAANKALEGKLDKLFALFGLKPGDMSDEDFAHDTERLLNEAACFDKIRTARCKLEDDGNDERFFEAMSEALDEHGLTPQPCPMCNSYGPHSHTI